ncbi:MAG: hypothetical protein DWQ20_00695 [Actinobacteria bacterium]|nr:MAG: hypothetical protein DWQ20_00695 [Actinomycetota bacterium]
MSRVDVVVNFDPAKVSAEVATAIHAGINRATIWGARETTRNYGSSGGGPFTRRVSKRTGRVYWSGPASPIGGYPAVRSGQLSASTTFEPARNFKGSFGASVAYARHVHRTRPFLTLTVDRNKQRIRDEFAKGYRAKFEQRSAG